MYNPAVTFGKIKPSTGSSSEHIRNKHARTVYKAFNTPTAAAELAVPTGMSYENRGLLRTAKMEHSTCFSHIDRRNLNINLHTVMDLGGVCAVQNASTQQCANGVNPNAPFYLNYVVDPSGELLGNTLCGVHNYERFMRPNITSTLYTELS